MQASDAARTTYAPQGYTFTDDQGVKYTITKVATDDANGEVEVSRQDHSLSGSITILGTVTYSGQEYKVTSIADGAFPSCSNLTSVTIRDNVTSIGKSAFYYCDNISEITIPTTVKSIGMDAFSSCSKLESVTLDKKSTASVPKELSIGYAAFEDCEQLKSADILEYATSIDRCAFQGCTSLSSVTLKDGLTSIGNFAFSDCKSISKIEIPKTVKSIGRGAFSGCGLISVAAGNNDFSVVDGVLYQNTTGGKKILHSCPSSKTGSFTIPNEIADDVTSIVSYAFSGCSGLTSVTIPNSVTAIGTNAFSNCNSLNAIYFTGTSAKWRSFNQGNPTNSKVHYVRTLALNNSAGVAVKMGDTVVNGAAEVIVPASEITNGKEVALTVENPDTDRYTYKWIVDGVESTGTSYTVSVKDADVNVTLKRIQKLTVDDLIITFPDGEYDGTEKKVTVTDKSYNDISCEITYTKEGETGGSTAAPKDAGTYKVTITIKDGEHNGEVIEAGSFTIKEKPEPKPDTPKDDDPNKGNEPTPAPVATYDLTVKGGTVKVNGKDAAAADGVIAVEKGAAVEVTFDRSTLSDAQVFDMWSIAPESVLNAVDPKAETLRFTMPAEKVTLEAMTRDASIADDGPGVLGTVAMVGVAGAGAAVLGYTGYMIGTELYLNTVLPAGAAIPQNYGELAKLLWTAAGMPVPAAVLAADATDEQKALAWAVENQLLPADKAADAFVTRWEVIRSWNQAQK